MVCVRTVVITRDLHQMEEIAELQYVKKTKYC